MFYDKYVELRIMFPTQAKRIGLKAIIEKQKLLYHGDERKFIKFMPKILNLISMKIHKLSDHGYLLTLEDALRLLKGIDP